MWVKLDDYFAQHRKVRLLSDAAYRLFVSSICWSARNRTAEEIPADRLREVSDVKHYKRAARELVERGLWMPIEGGWLLQQDFGGLSWDFMNEDRRTKIPLDLRFRVYERDGHCCLHCGSDADLTLDHIFPWSRGGKDAYENLQTLCRPCNSRKGATL